ncbi:MAG: TlpA family protein disulfide reductase [Lachnospiraceae bacterium]|nr:TlpA family protein disulfide reductase [Lachnospiraceae bacterium]
MKMRKMKMLMLSLILVTGVMTGCAEELDTMDSGMTVESAEGSGEEAPAEENGEEKETMENPEESEADAEENSTQEQEEAELAEEAKNSGESVVPENTSGLPSLNSFTATTLDGGSFSNENFADKDVTIINIWGTYCGPCQSEMPDLVAFAKSLPENVTLMTWCVDGAYEAESAKQILADAGLDSVTLVGGDGDLEALGNEIMYIPTTILVDSKGNIIGDALIGGRENLEADYTEAVNAALTALGKEKM